MRRVKQGRRDGRRDWQEEGRRTEIRTEFNCSSQCKRINASGTESELRKCVCAFAVEKLKSIRIINYGKHILDEIFSRVHTAPAKMHATWVAVYPVLSMMSIDRKDFS